VRAQVQVPAAVLDEPVQTLFVFGAAFEHGQVRFMPEGPPENAEVATVEHGLPMAPFAE
jgi:hypothetical protein